MNAHKKSDCPEWEQPDLQCAEPRAIDLVILKTVRLLSGEDARRLTFGQIYMHMVRSQPRVAPIVQLVVAVDSLVKEGLLISERVLDEDPTFPYTKHIISGLTDLGAACLRGEAHARSPGRRPGH